MGGSVAELRKALFGREPWLPLRWFWTPAAASLHRARHLSSDHYPSIVERLLVAEHAATLVSIFAPAEVVDLAPAASRHVRPLVAAMGEVGTGQRCLVVGRGGRHRAAVSGLAGDFPWLTVSGAERLATPEGGPRLLLLAGLGPDGPDRLVFAEALRRVSACRGPGDVILVGLDLGRDPEAFTRACLDREGRAEAFHRAALTAAGEALGVPLDPDDFRLEAGWDEAAGAVHTGLRVLRTVRFGKRTARLEAGQTIHTGRVAAWSRAGVRAVAARFGLTPRAWFEDPDGRRALVALGACGSTEPLL